VVNLLMAGAVLLFGRGVVPEDKINFIFLFFLGFAALDFWMPQMMKKKWQDEQAKLNAQGGAANTPSQGKN
jgi:hypothetical protein